MKNIILYLTITILFTACGAMSGTAVKEHHKLNTFNHNMDYMKTSDIIYDMSKYCSSGMYTIERKNYDSLNKSVISMRLKNVSTKSYYMQIEVDKVSDTVSRTSVYHYYDFENTRNMSMAVEKWVKNNSRTCVQGF